MSYTFDSGSKTSPKKPSGRRFSCIFARDSVATELLHGCPVVTGAGDRIGTVKSILIDTKTRQIRYVILSSTIARNTSVAVPWHAMYFDSALVRLVFYTYS
jgi:hypothetical protein